MREADTVDLARECARLVVENMRADHANTEARIRLWEERGYVVVGGGQTTGPDGNGMCGWEVTSKDGTVLRSGIGTIAEYEAALEELFPDGEGEGGWIFRDAIHTSGFSEDEVDAAVAADGAFLEYLPELPGLPLSLADAIREWVWGAPPEDVAAWVGNCTAAEVAVLQGRP